MPELSLEPQRGFEQTEPRRQRSRWQERPVQIVGKWEGTLSARCFPTLLTHSLHHLVPNLPPEMTVIIPGIMSRNRRDLLCLCVQEPVLGKEANLKEEALAGDGACLGLSLTTAPGASSDHLAHCARHCLTPSLFSVWSGLPRHTAEDEGSVPCSSAHNLACCLAHNTP